MAKDQLEQFKECGVERQIIFDIGSDDEVVMLGKGILLIPNSSQLEIWLKALISSAVDLEQIRNVSQKLQILKIHNICSLSHLHIFRAEHTLPFRIANLPVKRKYYNISINGNPLLL